MKKILLLVSIVATTTLLFGCGGNGGIAGTGGGKFTLTNDICKDFDADFVYSAIGKPIVRLEPSPLAGIMRCQYYVNYRDDFYTMPDGSVRPGGDYVSIQYENTLNVERQKKGNEALGYILKEDPRIKMEHFIAVQEDDGLINTTYLVLGPNEFINVNRRTASVLNEDEIIAFAAKVAEKLKGNLSFKISENPVDTTTEEEKALAAEPSHEQIVKDFFAFLADKNIDSALQMMDADDNSKQMRGVNFNTIKSLKVTKMEPVFQEEWTSERQVFKVNLNVNVTGEGEQYGRNPGTNMRRVSVQKTNGNRMIHELANNP